ncbi:MAG: hypothetical protein ACI4F7_08855 [Acutalibacteraceae bacterium]
MKTFEERKAEVMLRSEKILKKRKKRNKIILTLVPISVCLCAVSAAAVPNVFSGEKNTAPESSVNETASETESETYAASETPPQTTKPTNGSSSRLPMLEISEDEGGYGCEAYWAYDISELVNANPWNKEVKLSTLPVYKTAADTPVTDAEFAEMEKFLKEIANKLGLDDDKLNISKNPSELSAESKGIKLKVDRTMFLTVTLDPAVTLPQKYDFSYYAPFDSMKNAAEYLKEKYSALFDQNKYALNIHGGDYDIYLRQHHYISFYCTEGDSTQKIINYNFNKIYFSPDDNGRLFLISIHRADLSDKVGDYPIITSEKAEELLKAGKYVTSVPHTLNGEENIAKVELIYRNAPWDKYYMPYYRFYVETPYEEMGDMKEYGLKEYGAYYVPAVEERYISNMPLWDGSFN